MPDIDYSYDYAVEQNGTTTYYYPGEAPRTTPKYKTTATPAPPAASQPQPTYQQPNNTTTAPTLNADQQSAKGIITSTLDAYGLGSLADKAWQMYLNGEPIEQIMLDIRKTPEYQARFPGMAQLQKNGRAISEGDYINLERQYVSLFRQAGLPAGFYDQPADFAGFIANEVSPQEMSGRLDVARQALYETPPQVRDELARQYGLNSGDVMAFLLDPTKALPIIQQQFAAASAGAASRLGGFGMLTRAEAESLSTSGFNFGQFAQGFDQLAQEKELFAPIIGEQGESLTREDQLSSVFGGNTAAQRRIQRRAEARKAAFGGGGGFAATQGGVTGLGSASS